MGSSKEQVATDTDQPTIHEAPAPNDSANATHRASGDAASRRMARAETGAWADEVHGVPTGSRAIAGDDGESGMETTVTEEKRGYKKVTTTDGDHKHIEEKKTGFGGGGLQRQRTEEESVGDVSTKTTNTKTVNSSGYTAGKTNEAKVGDKSITDGHEHNVGPKGISTTKTHKEADADGEHGTTRGGSIGPDGIKYSMGESREKKSKVQELSPEDGQHHEVEKKDTRDKKTTVAVSRDAVSADHERSHTDVNGNKSATSGGGEWGKDKKEVHASQTYSDAKGNSAGGNVHAGVHIEASEPVEEKNGQWVVHYTKTKDVGGGANANVGGKAGANVNVGKAHIEEGTRSFKTKKEADDFKKNVAERVHDAGDPTTAKGAEALEIGESRGIGDATTIGAGGNAKIEGASAHFEAHKTTGDEVDVKRISATVYEVTSKHTVEKGMSGGVGGAGVAVSKSSTTTDVGAVSVKFDFSKPDGKRGFEKFAKDHALPAEGGFDVVYLDTHKNVKTEDMKLVALGSASYDQHTEHDKQVDSKGTHLTDAGGQGHSVNTSWLSRKLGDKDQHQDVELTAHTDNGQASSYTIEAHIGGERGLANRGYMNRLAGGGEEKYDDSKVDKGHSGEWTMTAEVDKQTIANEEKYNSNLNKYKTHEERMQALAQEMADRGAKEVSDLNVMGAGKLSWELELKGDKNFPGREGRVAIDEKIERYQTALANAATAPMLLPAIEQDADALKVRRAAVADKSQYLDLPEALRTQQLQVIDGQLGRLEGLRHQAALEVTKNKPGESADAAEKRIETKQHGAGTPQQQDLFALRDKIAVTDHGISDTQKNVADGRAALSEGGQHIRIDEKSAHRWYRKAKDASIKVVGAVQSATAQYQRAEAMRSAFLKALGDPNAALALGRTLQAELDVASSSYWDAWMTCREAGVGIFMLNDRRPPPGHAAFWKEVEQDAVGAEEMPDEIATAKR